MSHVHTGLNSVLHAASDQTILRTTANTCVNSTVYADRNMVSTWRVTKAQLMLEQNVIIIRPLTSLPGVPSPPGPPFSP